ncbi:hypothetical protein V1J52_11010 [Streptomyces sp. TRM 70351]|uniref:hypothetical protein n=1 Tax=Streptomyces sp. TRM 70351 TaxID=3116552 RepID=UPI002E7AC517|nr:hypothetical protein [Streptomyces sp. TRM 70351]MEE1928719.1 hypothetical protein [Streptomyces sp. TRM 70351]
MDVLWKLVALVGVVLSVPFLAIGVVIAADAVSTWRTRLARRLGPGACRFIGGHVWAHSDERTRRLSITAYRCSSCGKRWYSDDT